MFAPSSSSSSEDEQRNDHPILSAARAVAARAKKTRPNTEAIAAAAAAAYEGNDDEGDKGKSANAAQSEEKSKSRYIGKLLVSAKQRAEEAEMRRANQAERSQIPRFVTKSYEAALRRRDEERRSKIAAVTDNEGTSLEGKREGGIGSSTEINKSHGAALMFVVEQAAEKAAATTEQAIDQAGKEEGEDKTIDKTKPEKDKEHSPERVVHKATDKIEGKPDVVQPAAESSGKTKKRHRKSQKIRGLRRNDEQSIEAYRRRYFERLAIAQKEKTLG